MWFPHSAPVICVGLSRCPLNGFLLKPRWVSAYPQCCVLLASVPAPPPISPVLVPPTPTCFRVGRDEQVVRPGLESSDLIPGVTSGRGLQDAFHIVHSNATHTLRFQSLHLVQGQCQGSEILLGESVTLRQLKAACLEAYRQGRAETSGPAWSCPSGGSWLAREQQLWLRTLH